MIRFTPELDYDLDSFDDIIAKDDRYDRRAYALMMYVVGSLVHELRKGEHFTSADVMNAFRECALDQFGPLSYDVLKQWGVTCTEDIGAMMFNLVDSHRVAKDAADSREDFVGGYDFMTEFFAIFQA